MGSNSDSEEDEEDRPLSTTKRVKKPQLESKKRKRDVVDDDSDDDNQNTTGSNRNRLLSSIKAVGSMGSNSDSEEDEEDRPLSTTKRVKKPQLESKKRKRDVVDDDSDDDNQDTTDDGNALEDGNTTDDGNHGTDDGNPGNGDDTDDDEIRYDDCNGENFEDDEEDLMEKHDDRFNHCTQILSSKEQKQSINKQLKNILVSSKKAGKSMKELLNLFEENDVEIDAAKSCPTLYKLYLFHNQNLLLLELLDEKSMFGRTAGDANRSAFLDLSIKLNLNEFSRFTKSDDEPTDYTDYKQIYQKVRNGKEELSRIKNQFKRHWRTKYRKFLGEVYTDPTKDNRGKVPRKTSQKGKKKTKGQVGAVSGLLTMTTSSNPTTVQSQQQSTPQPPLVTVSPPVLSSAVVAAPVDLQPVAQTSSAVETPPVLLQAPVEAITALGQSRQSEGQNDRHIEQVNDLEARLQSKTEELNNAYQKIRDLEEMIKELTQANE